MVATYDITHGDRVDGMPQIRQSTLDPTIAPRRMLFCHADHELFDLLRDTRASQLWTMPAPVTLLGNQSLVPAQERVGGGNRGELFEAFPAKRVDQRSETAAFRVGQAQQAAAQLSFEDAVFFL